MHIYIYIYLNKYVLYFQDIFIIIKTLLDI